MLRTFASLFLLAFSVSAGTLSLTGAFDPNNPNNAALISMTLITPASDSVPSSNWAVDSSSSGLAPEPALFVEVGVGALILSLGRFMLSRRDSTLLTRNRNSKDNSNEN